MLSGRVNPSAFYLMMELVLLQSKAGQLWALDAWLTLKVRLLDFYPQYIKMSYYIKRFLQSNTKMNQECHNATNNHRLERAYLLVLLMK